MKRLWANIGQRLRGAFRTRWGKVLLAFFVLGLLWYAFSLWQVSRDIPPVDSTTHADVIVVLGCGAKAVGVPSTCQRNRTAVAVNLWRAGTAPHLIFTGGDSGTGIESQTMARLAMDSGLPAAAILTEERSRDTVENIRYSRPLLAEQQWSRVVLVSDSFHLYRAGQIASCQHVTIVGRGAVPQVVDGLSIFSALLSVAREGGALMLFEVTQWSACT